jgi:hypothetical protein
MSGLGLISRRGKFWRIRQRKVRPCVSLQRSRQQAHFTSFGFDFTWKETIVINRLLRTYPHAALAMILLGDGWNHAAAQRPPDALLAPPLPQISSTPVKGMLPPPPKARAQKTSAFVDSLAEVPELTLTDPIVGSLNGIEAFASQIAGIHALTKEKSDRFVEKILAERADLAGLPFQMGNSCRLSEMQSRCFKQAVALVHGARNAHNTTVGTTSIWEWPTAFMTDNFAPDRKRVHDDLKAVLEGQTAGRIDQAKVTNIRKASADLKSRLFEIRFNVSFSEYANALEFLSKLDEPLAILEKSTVLPDDGSDFLARFTKACLADDDSARKGMKKHQDHAASARLAAMMQICGPTSDSMKLAMVKYIASVSSIDSTQALVKTILFTPEEDARNVAIDALKARRDKDFVDALLQGFRYPWPDVAMRAGDALVKLDRTDLVPQIIDVLDEADPRAPTAKNVNGKKEMTVREIVRINHLCNCLMCHAPGQDVQNDPNILTADVTLPGQTPPSSSGYGSHCGPELLVRVDVTYLRQDFSMMLPAADRSLLPEKQRFDYFVRTRTLSEGEVKAYKEKFDKLKPGALPPNHQAALAALRRLTGKDTDPTAEAWRKMLAMK